MKAIVAILVVLFVIGWWRSEAAAAKRENRPTLVERLASGSTESEKALRKPETMTPEQRQLAAAWGNGSKEAYVEQSDSLEARLDGRLEGGYVWGPDSERRARMAIRTLNEAIDRDDFLAVPGRFAKAKEAVRMFEAGTRWRAGLRHRTLAHISSAEKEGYWTTDPGWIFPKKGSLEVARVCRRCDGSGQEVVKVTCDRCNGTGKIAAPLSGVTSTLEGLAGATQALDDFSRALKGKPSRGGRSRPSRQNLVTCNGCNGRSKVEALQPCSACGGQGWVR